jgi:hypothetical protein
MGALHRADHVGISSVSSQLFFILNFVQLYENRAITQSKIYCCWYFSPAGPQTGGKKQVDILNIYRYHVKKTQNLFHTTLLLGWKMGIRKRSMSVLYVPSLF